MNILRRLGFLLALFSPAFAGNYYVTQNGAGSGNGTSLSNAWSVATYSALPYNNAIPVGGDTIHFSGTFTTTITHTINNAGLSDTNRITLDFAGATLNTANPAVWISGSFVTLDGGGRWNNGSYTASCIIGARNGTVAGTPPLIFTFNSNYPPQYVTIKGFQDKLADDTNIHSFIYLNNVTNLIVEQNDAENLDNFITGDSTQSHDLVIRNNYACTNHNILDQSDLIRLGDAYNVTIEGNKFLLQAPGSTSGRHNDIIQTYMKGGSFAGNPYGWIIRYNWLELDVRSGSGDTSWCMLEAMKNNGSTPAMKIYSNIFVGDSTGSASNNGVAVDSNAGATFYLYNNTFKTYAGYPGNASRFLNGGSDILFARNNAFYDPVGGGGTYLDWGFAAGATWDYNVYYKWNGVTSTYTGSHGLSNTDPLFVSQSIGDFSTLATSPLVARGDSSIGAEYNQGISPGSKWPGPTLVARTSWDIGAFQSSGAAATPPSGATTSISVH